MKIGIASMLAGAAVAVAIGLQTPASHASGNAPWCAVIDLGSGNAYWDCRYKTVEQCAPNVVAGNRGSCTQNPSAGGWAAATGYRYRTGHDRHRHTRRE